MPLPSQSTHIVLVAKFVWKHNVSFLWPELLISRQPPQFVANMLLRKRSPMMPRTMCLSHPDCLPAGIDLHKQCPMCPRLALGDVLAVIFEREFGLNAMMDIVIREYQDNII